ncbi:protocadherin-23-like [Lathamus discolor]|uniref:protocadherin-23-like n=1 Tax=Lathamus discolor TaxID=678569 RepID=UPI0032B8728F
MDVNDNAPVFTQDSYSASINMINPVGTHVITVSATDKDQGLNGLVEYYILPDQNFIPFFLIEDMSEGKIITTGSLPRSGEMHLTVMARDKGSPSLNATAVITLEVFDNSPFVPQFNRSEISVSVLENTGVDYLIYDFTAIETSGKQIDYTIASGNEKGHFTLDPKSGQLRTAVNLNYEEVSEYVLLVEANENLPSATQVQYASLFAENVAMLRVSVQDVNEEPVFLSDAYSARIPNSVPYKYPVITVQATDPDSGDNGRLLYSLVTSQSNEFDIDENTGQVFTVSVAGKAGTFYLEVQATDQGTSRLTAQTTVSVTVDSSSSNNIVVVVLSEMINIVERNIIEVKRVLEDKLAWNVYIVEVYSNEAERTARSSTDVTYVKIIAFDEANQEVPAEDVKRKLQEQKSNIETELEKIFSRPVTTSIEEAPADSASPELIATIVLSVLLACSLIGFLVYVAFTVKRKRKQEQQYLVKQRAEIAEGIDNPWATDKNGSVKSLEKLEHINNVEKEMVAFSNTGNTEGTDSDKDLIQADEKCSYLETLLLDFNSKHEDNGASEKAAEPRNVDAQHTAGFTAKQVTSFPIAERVPDEESLSGILDGFLTDRNQEPAPSSTPQPTTPPPGKDLKGVKFSEVAIILEGGSEEDEPDTADGPCTTANA